MSDYFVFFLCQKGIIRPDKLPDKWGLLEVNENMKVRKKVGPKGNIWSHHPDWMFTDRNIQNEISLMYSALRRLHLQGVMPFIYEKFRTTSPDKE